MILLYEYNIIIYYSTSYFIYSLRKDRHYILIQICIYRYVHIFVIIFTVYYMFQHHSQVDVIFTDFHKAFDTLNLIVLIKILNEFGIGEPLLSWFKSYLENRYQWVKLFNFKSNLFHASSGVPQGGHLYPLLFSVFINNLGEVIHHSRFICFADDIKLFMKIDSIEYRR